MSKLAAIKAGDYVAIRTGGWHPRIERARVERVTATQIVAAGLRFAIRTGRRVGRRGYLLEWIEPWTPENAAKLAELVEQQRTWRDVARLQDFDWRKLDRATLDAVLNLLPKEPA